MSFAIQNSSQSNINATGGGGKSSNLLKRTTTVNTNGMPPSRKSTAYSNNRNTLSPNASQNMENVINGTLSPVNSIVAGSGFLASLAITGGSIGNMTYPVPTSHSFSTSLSSTPYISQSFSSVTPPTNNSQQSSVPNDYVSTHYVYIDVADIDYPISVKIGSIEGFSSPETREKIEQRQRKKFSTGNEKEQSLLGRNSFDIMYVECQILGQDGAPLCYPCRTAAKKLRDSCFSWDEWITFPVRYKELSSDASISISIFDSFSPTHSILIGSMIFPFGGKKGILRTGKYKIRLSINKGTSDLSSEEISKCKVKDDIISIDKMVNLYTRGGNEPVEWLDILTFSKINEMKEKYIEPSEEILMNIELEQFCLPAAFKEVLDRYLPDSDFDKSNSNEGSSMHSVASNGGLALSGIMHNDPEVKQINLAEEKNLKLSLGLSNPLVDRDLKPNAEETRRIQAILDYPPIYNISPKDKVLLWKFRYWLCSNKRAMIKFMKSVDWVHPKEKQEAITLLDLWAKIDIVDALYLLSKIFENVEPVRTYAVSILQKADNDEVLDILLQLVQALRYEKNGETSELATFLIDRAVSDFSIANNLHWYIEVEAEDRMHGTMFKNLQHKLWVYLSKKGASLFVEKLSKQKKLVQALKEVGKQLKADKDPRPKKILKLKKILDSKAGNWNWDEIMNSNVSSKFEPSPVTLPLAPEIEATKIIAEDASIFKSAMSPMLVPFLKNDGGKYPVIFKCGDDLRQDQLIIQLIHLMDKLLKKNGLDLKLTPYRVLATGPDNGFVECITPNTAISKIARGDIKAWLKKHAKNEDEIRQVCQNFVKSCAGYCVITYILGIGDRHLDNVLMTPNGQMFHIDFGFILGRDPKPFAPPMKLCKEMVEGMGGARSEGYMKFKELCCTAYNILRKSADLILNMFVLMSNANIPDIQHGAGGDPLKNIMKVQDKFKLDLNDAQAMQFMQSVINESERALFPQITETIHKWAQYWRS